MRLVFSFLIACPTYFNFLLDTRNNSVLLVPSSSRMLSFVFLSFQLILNNRQIISMKRILHRVDAAGRTAGLKLNAKKTKVLHVTSPNQQGHTDIKVDKIPLEKVNEFKYLGSIKTNNGTCSKDIKVRITMAKNKMLQLNNIWKDHSLPIHLSRGNC